ncbi:MAG: pentapeptide repeat-containing protein [Coleofasciculus sp. C1-SOL-03]|uniref:pentapeptide repeat-containing protein n=1 Tax=Coleofasciculus sp. C1-SOL-03 TaxID=3069522 RepID=UPI0032FAC8E5
MSDSGQPLRRRRRRNSAFDDESSHSDQSTQPQHQGQLTRSERQEIVDLLRQESADNFLQRAREIGLNPKTDFAELNLSGVNLSPASFQYADLTGVNLSQANLSNAHLNHAKLTNANLQQANLQQSNLSSVDLSSANLKEANLSNADFNNANLSQTNLQQADLSNANLNDTNLNNANLEEANLENAKLAAIKLQGAKCDRANFQGVRFYDQFKYPHHQTDNLSQISFKGANFANTSLAGLNLSHADLSHAHLNQANLSGANLTHANLEGANLEKANLAKIKLQGAKCDRANFQGVRFSSENQYKAWDLSQISFQGANFANTYLYKLNFSYSDFSHANFQQAQLTQIDLNHANLKGTNFQGVTLHQVTLKGAIIDEQTQLAASWRKVIAVLNQTHENLELQNLDLSRQDFSGFNLAGANLQSTKLCQTNFRHTDLSHANLSHADLTSANLENANLKGANLTGVDLSETNLLGTQIDQTTNLDPMWRRAWAAVNSPLDAESSNYLIREVMPAILERYRDRIEATIKPYLELKLIPDQNLTWWQSKFPGKEKSRGGFPYLPKGFEYPKTPDGKYLFLLAQINLAEIPHLEGFPKQGILQFYIPSNNDDFYESVLSSQCKLEQNYFRVLFFPETDLNDENIITNFDFLPEKDDHTAEPFAVECSAIKWAKGYEPISHYDYDFGDRFPELFDEDEMEDFYEEFYGYLEYKFSGANCDIQIGGYTSFYQDDPRYGLGSEEDPFDTLLLQIRLVENGSLYFYIQSSALARCDFSRILYAMA